MSPVTGANRGIGAAIVEALLRCDIGKAYASPDSMARQVGEQYRGFATRIVEADLTAVCRVPTQDDGNLLKKISSSNSEALHASSRAPVGIG